MTFMTLPSIAQLANKHNIKPLKKFGQNFIYDSSLCDKIVIASGLLPEDVAIEIGPGPAGLTRSILKQNPERLIVIETDQRCMPLLSEIQDFYPNLEIIHNDAKKVKIAELLNQNDYQLKNTPNIRIISNLPYNIGTILLIQWLEEIDLITSLTLMLQREVVDRITATVGTKNYGRLSVICQLMCDAKKCFDVSPKAFYPAPKVWSSIVHLTHKSIIPDKDIINKVQHITNLAFSGRRKMIKSSLNQLISFRFNINYESIDDLLKACNIDKTMRAENLSPQNYLDLALAIYT